MNLQPSRTDRGCVRRTSRSVDEGGVSVGRPKGVEACGHAAARATPIAAVRFMVFQCASASRRSRLSMNLRHSNFGIRHSTFLTGSSNVGCRMSNIRVHGLTILF